MSALLGISGCMEKMPEVVEQPQQSELQPATQSQQPSVTPELETEPAAEFSEQMIFNDLAYASASPAQILDLYVPAGTGPFPLVIIIHSGGFMSGDKTDGSEINKIKVLLKEGFAAASINYRLSGEAIFPAQVFDAKTAVRYLRANSKEYNLDPSRFGAWGSSAGGTLVSLLGVTCNIADLEGSDLGNPEQSSCIQAAVDWFGLVDLLKMEEQFAGTECPGGFNNPESAESKWVGAPIQTVPQLVSRTNPMNYIDADDPPFLIQHGSKDCRVPPVQSKAFADALKAVIGDSKVIFTELPEAGHGGGGFKTDANLELVINFLNSNLK